MSASTQTITLETNSWQTTVFDFVILIKYLATCCEIRVKGIVARQLKVRLYVIEMTKQL